MTKIESLQQTPTVPVSKGTRGRLFLLDLSGGRVLSLNPDGSDKKVLATDCRWPDGVAVDVEAGHIYWTQKGPDDAGLGHIFRANIEIPKGETPANRTDIEMIFENLPEPIDLELDLENHVLYWTDRGDPPRGNTVNRASLDAKPRQAVPEILVTHLMEGIGIALDFRGDRMFVTDLAGSVYAAALDGSGKKPVLAAQGNLTGIAFAELPTNS